MSIDEVNEDIHYATAENIVIFHRDFNKYANKATTLLSEISSTLSLMRKEQSESLNQNQLYQLKKLNLLNSIPQHTNEQNNENVIKTLTYLGIERIKSFYVRSFNLNRVVKPLKS